MKPAPQARSEPDHEDLLSDSTRDCAVLWLLCLAHPAGAADLVSPVTPGLKPVETEQGWTYAVAPYFWVAGISVKWRSSVCPPSPT
jgi:hypothetical protein